MKKLFIVLFVFFSVSLCFAKGQRDAFEVGIGYHNITENQTVSGIDVKTTVPSFAINFAGVSFYTDTVGIGAYGNFLFPQELTISAMGESLTVDKSAYDFLFALDFLIGPTFMVYTNESFSLPITVGIHYLQLWANASAGNTNSNAIGLGANITGEYHFNQRIYAYARFQLSLDFYSWGKAEQYTGYGYSVSQSFSESMITWGLSPCIGIGFQF